MPPPKTTTTLLAQRATVFRFLAFVNHANMGSYREANNAYLSGKDPTPDVAAYRQQGRVKYGFGVNFEQELGRDWRAYGRFGWEEGHNESFAYTEANQTFSAGTDLRGSRWKRPRDKAAVAVMFNGLSGDHRTYLALGGLGFLLGDGALNYDREKIIEFYYNWNVWRGVYLAFDLQQVWNPGYNRDRGPVIVPTVRFHFEGALPFSRPESSGN